MGLDDQAGALALIRAQHLCAIACTVSEQQARVCDSLFSL